MPGDADGTVRRVERTAWYVCAGVAFITLILGRGRIAPVVAVLAGGALVGLAYWTMKSGIANLTIPQEADRRAPVKAVVKVVGRYALLGFLAYVMIARLRLHPLGLLAGASSFVAAVSIETLRLLIRKH
jgi:hypothetical protein